MFAACPRGDWRQPVQYRAAAPYPAPCSAYVAPLYLPMAVGHYENFPVASLLLPRRLRPAVRAIYRFARSADDIADEGQASADERRAALHAYSQALSACERGQVEQVPAPLAPIFQPLAQAMTEHHLPWQACHDLLSAFEQDVCTLRYGTQAALLDYCRRSANPVGRLMLGLYRHPGDATALAQADAICTGLQLTNFCQDVAIDWDRGRLYIPLDELAAHGLTDRAVRALPEQRNLPVWQALMAGQTARARRLLQAGAPLPRTLGGRIGWELRLVIQGGLRILERVDAARGNVFDHRPVLGARDWALMFWRTLAP
ncbi:squalene synthase HpnC [Kerstersia gyiorum]|uniref:Squalene synthase HpnC n=2 Tax=Kerstersia gyiorum TaxID=206506 RepID=A0A4Q7M6W5_9BURK|nr:squalene synthase HpnC [Kerstersia gyiorum]